MQIEKEHNNNVLHDTLNAQADNYIKLTSWIPVSEQLPEEPQGAMDKDGLYDVSKTEKYIVTVEGMKRPTCLFYAGNNTWMDIDYDFYKVTAWMTMPEIYKS